MTATELEVGGRRVALSNLDKVLWPAAGFTKGAMLDYYRRVAPALLPHLAGRAVTLRRFPDGVESHGWYQTECRGAPPWLTTADVEGRRGQRFRMCLVEDAAALVWVANLATIELHPFLARAATPDRPAALAFDLDPGPPADVVACSRVALAIRARLERVGLAAFPKTSGSVGLHVYLPLDGSHGYDATKAFARSVAETLAAERPDAVVATTKRAARAGRVLVDWLQNDPARSTVAPYSLRATAWPTVSTPVTWEEVEEAAGTGRAELLTFTAADVLARVEHLGDLFRPVLELAQRLPAG